jgi:hypothetical protein
MRRTALMNPFELSPEPSQMIDRRARRATRTTPVCSNCNSDDIISQATAQWSNEAQEWRWQTRLGNRLTVIFVMAHVA